MAITQKLAEIVGDVDRPGDFFARIRFADSAWNSTAPQNRLSVTVTEAVFAAIDVGHREQKARERRGRS
jgi:hypothetical protein